MKAVVDRFEGGYAVVLFGDEEIGLTFPGGFFLKMSGRGAGLESASSWTRVGRRAREKDRGPS